MAGKEKENLSRTPGTEGDKEIDAPLVLAPQGPRDALVDPDENDFVPDVDEKGYHTGLVRQPASPVGNEARGMTGFVSQGGESKFAYGSLAHLKAAHNASEKDRKGVDVSPPMTEEEAEARAGNSAPAARRRRPAAEPAPVE